MWSIQHANYTISQPPCLLPLAPVGETSAYTRVGAGWYTKGSGFQDASSGDDQITARMWKGRGGP